MNTNFFNQIQQLDFKGVLQLNISKGIESNLIVTVLLNNEQCGDSAKNLIAPLLFNATPQQVDEVFFEQITAPIQKVSGLMVDMEKFLKQLEEAKKQSAMEEDKTEKVNKVQEVKDKKFKEGMAKANELEAAGKFRDAWMKVPEIAEFPEKAEEIRKRKSELSAKFAPDLFATPVQEKPQALKNELLPETQEEDFEDELEEDSLSINEEDNDY